MQCAWKFLVVNNLMKFTGGQRLDAQGVDVSLQHVIQSCIDHSMASQQGLGRERGCDDAHRIVATTRMGVTGMLCTVILDFQFQRVESGFQPLAQTFDALLGIRCGPGIAVGDSFYGLHCDQDALSISICRLM
jgi:hypothetical protein